jgi:glyceraldehyde-3-phosphate dehydrogenase (NAD(P))
VVALLEAAPRVAVVDGPTDLGLLQAAEERRELVVWRDGLAADGTAVHLSAWVQMEAIVLPEMLDCVRALAGAGSNGSSAVSIMQTTDRGLGLTHLGTSYPGGRA